MVIIRPTQKLRNVLPLTETVDGESDTALGDWYVNRIVVDRQPLLLLISSKGLLPLVHPARDVRSLPKRLPTLVALALQRMDVPRAIVAAEVAAMSDAVVAPTRDRSILGILVDIGQTVPFHLDAGHWDDSTLPVVEARLAQTPWFAAKSRSEVIFARDEVPRLLIDRWGAF